LPHHKLGALQTRIFLLATQNFLVTRKTRIFLATNPSAHYLQTWIFACNKFFCSLTTHKLEFLLATIFYKNRILLLLKKNPHMVKLFIFKSTILLNNFLLHGNLRISWGCEIFSSQKY
jgi:hypothetical protein